MSAKDNIFLFWSFVDKTPGQGPNGDCWVWIGRKDPSGYGITPFGRDNNIPGRKGAQRAHRIAYELKVDKNLPTKDILMHSCDNRACVNPAHLSPGTQGDNVFDMVAKGRHMKGEEVPTAVLTTEQVEQIKIYYAAGYDVLAISDLLKLSPSTLRSTINYNWKSVVISNDDPRVEALRPVAKEYMENRLKNNSPLSIADIRKVKKLITEGHTNASLAKQFKCGSSTISRIRTGKTGKGI